MSKKDPKDPSVTSMAYDRMLPKWMKIQTVLEGTEAMRAAGTTYLPQHKEEKDGSYQERLQRATLLNLAELTLSNWVGRPFSDPLQFMDTPTLVKSLLSDVDLLGNDAHTFCRTWFSEGIAKAYAHCYIDFPRLETGEGVRTMAADREEGVRPYWVLYPPEQVFFADVEMRDGREILREVRIMEDVTGRDGFAETCEPQIRRIVRDELGAVSVELYRRRKQKSKQVWVMVDTYPISLDFIPLVTFYADREGFMCGKPPLEDLVDLNIAHWQSTSDQRACLTVARFPILALSGGTDDDSKLVVGPNRWLYSGDVGSKFYYVEHSGAAIEAGRKDLLDLESQMSEYGAEFLKKRPGGQTATARALDSAEATSPLQDVTLRFKSALEQVLYFTAKWLKLDTGGTVEIETDFGPEVVDPSELTTLADSRKQRDISRLAYLAELKRRGLLSDEYDAEKDLDQLELEAMSLVGRPPEPPNLDKPKDGEPEEDEDEDKPEDDEGQD